jgi:sulfonate transport system substrate-binding protein
MDPCDMQPPALEIPGALGRRRALTGAVTRGLLASLALALRPARAAQASVVHLGVQKGGSLIILRDRHGLEPALKPAGVEVAWTEFPGGPQLLEALNVGAIDFGTTGEAPPIFAQAAGAPLLYVGAQPSAPRSEAIIVPEGSPLRIVAQLKGKRVALNKGSNVHFLLVRALASAGLKPADVQPIYLAPADARAAFEQGAVDAWVIWNPFLAAARAATKARVLVDATGLAPNREFLLASRKLADARPNVVRTILLELDKADRWAQANQAEAAGMLAPDMGLPVSVVETSLNQKGYGVGPITPDVVRDQQRIADTFHRLGLIPTAVDVASAVWSPSS